MHEALYPFARVHLRHLTLSLWTNVLAPAYVLTRETLQSNPTLHRRQRAHSKRSQLGLARSICIRCISVFLGREITKYTVIYGVYVRSWPTLLSANYVAFFAASVRAPEALSWLMNKT